MVTALPVVGAGCCDAATGRGSVLRAVALRDLAPMREAAVGGANHHLGALHENNSFPHATPHVQGPYHQLEVTLVAIPAASSKSTSPSTDEMGCKRFAMISQ